MNHKHVDVHDGRCPRWSGNVNYSSASKCQIYRWLQFIKVINGPSLITGTTIWQTKLINFVLCDKFIGEIFVFFFFLDCHKPITPIDYREFLTIKPHRSVSIRVRAVLKHSLNGMACHRRTRMKIFTAMIIH